MLARLALPSIAQGNELGRCRGQQDAGNFLDKENDRKDALRRSKRRQNDVSPKVLTAVSRLNMSSSDGTPGGVKRKRTNRKGDNRKQVCVKKSSSQSKRVMVHDALQCEEAFVEEAEDVPVVQAKLPKLQATVEKKEQEVDSTENTERTERTNQGTSVSTSSIPDIHLSESQWNENTQLISSLSSIVAKDNSDIRVMYAWMLEREKLYQPAGDTIRKIKQLDASMRAILLDWMMEVSQEFALGRETMHLACNYVDRILTLCANKESEQNSHSKLNKGFINRKNLQLLGVTCLFIASKLEEIYPPNVVDFASTTDDAYTTQEIDAMERIVLQELKWFLQAQTPFSWLKLFCKLVSREIHHTQYKKNPKACVVAMRQVLSVDFCTRVMEIVDMAMMDTVFLQFYPSALAASAMLHVLPQASATVEAVSPYSVKQLEPITFLLKRFSEVPSCGPRPPSKQCLDLKIPPEDMFTRQVHNQIALNHSLDIAPVLAQDWNTLLAQQRHGGVDGKS